MKKNFLNNLKYFNKKINDIFCEIIIKISSKKENKEQIFFQPPPIKFLLENSKTNTFVNDRLRKIYHFIQISSKFGVSSTRVEVEFESNTKEDVLYKIQEQLALSTYEIVNEDQYTIINKNIKVYYLKWKNEEIIINNKKGI